MFITLTPNNPPMLGVNPPSDDILYGIILNTEDQLGQVPIRVFNQLNKRDHMALSSFLSKTIPVPPDSPEGTQPLPASNTVVIDPTTMLYNGLNAAGVIVHSWPAIEIFDGIADLAQYQAGIAQAAEDMQVAAQAAAILKQQEINARAQELAIRLATPILAGG